MCHALDDGISMNIQRHTRLTSQAPAAVILIRLMVGAIFLSEGIQKFLFPEALGVGRFVKIGIPAPAVLAPFVGVVEIGCGCLILLGLLTRLVALPLIIDMLVAIVEKEPPPLKNLGSEQIPAEFDWIITKTLRKNPDERYQTSKELLRRQHPYASSHEARTDYAMLLGLIFLLIVGAGRWSLDAYWGPHVTG